MSERCQRAYGWSLVLWNCWSGGTAGTAGTVELLAVDSRSEPFSYLTSLHTTTHGGSHIVKYLYPRKDD